MSEILERLGIAANRQIPQQILRATGTTESGEKVTINLDDRSLAAIIAGLQLDIFKTASGLSQFTVSMGETGASGEEMGVAEGSGELFIDKADGKVYYDAPARVEEGSPVYAWEAIGYLTHDGTTPLTGEWDTGPTYGIKQPYLKFYTTFTAVDHVEGRLWWNLTDGTLQIDMPGGNVRLQIGQEVLFRCTNKTGVTITNGTPLYITGAQGSRPTVAPAAANSIVTTGVVGFATEDILDQVSGFATVIGQVRDIDTDGIAAGTLVYLGEFGGYTSTRPTAPVFKVFLGYVLFENSSSGVIIINPIIVPRLMSLSDVLEFPSPTDGQFPNWVASNLRFELRDRIRYNYPLSEHIDEVTRFAEHSIWGGLHSLTTAQTLNSISPVNVTASGSKLVIVPYAGIDFVGSVTVTGTKVDRDTGAETPAYVDTITFDGVSTDGSTIDAQGNTVHTLTDAYITNVWFTGAVTIATTDTSTTIDVYQVTFHQCNDEPNIEMDSIDWKGLATNANAWVYIYMYSIEKMAGDKCDVAAEVSMSIDTVPAANGTPKLRRGNIGRIMDGTTDGFWVDVFYGPIAQTYWEDVSLVVNFKVTP